MAQLPSAPIEIVNIESSPETDGQQIQDSSDSIVNTTDGREILYICKLFMYFNHYFYFVIYYSYK